MTEPELSAADAAVRARIDELSVHIPCGGIRGPIQRRSRARPDLPIRWQSCRDEDNPERWPEHDVSRAKDLCVICFRGTAGGRSRWAYVACETCLAVNDSYVARWGFRPFALGRHSLMNGAGARLSAAPAVRHVQEERLAAFSNGDHELKEWRRREYPRLAAAFDPLADIPLRTWRATWPPSRSASEDAFARLLGD
ncbi:hypothetical protein [Mycolicibacterium arseniciresistens]|uniref:Uncharacterized protein n=1 Tax=Mycolicibacterium arseniciresistens TaxID=3062257 RepID=A0ABT8U9I1_9MYCO|nr:hypothetical protein [Mycolicibacterium arseniciresistens]MDO3634445.1 hypothetical protein [Mycolicibacterium arseniciresistens]